ncbi:bifunctional metallophosphatase/5'-nucleotidase [Fulvivirga sediminis]|uniref:Bifunctional metallophosphatase/5'-nucleotidase n=1 Tax=Fulvivirga sediminis TaxID=2803949 RepID=A0A937F4A6_9BACT|nr:bifunctional UDP-sugar hydrolase/5'-nucleotidase [Fulvivirga sediminis]MBL3656102.1 bifunctional metallophosphatase/5'-nucleotidase [Fulvivirga sediminis]
MRLSISIILIFFIRLTSLSFIENISPTTSADPADENPVAIVDSLTIFFMNDMHGEIRNFAKAKHIIDRERENKEVLVLCAGDIFSGNPVVDQYDPKGEPMVAMMNEIGVDVAVLGNHEFDYGIDVLKDRMEQAQFSWICANMNTEGSVLPQTEPYAIKDIDDLKIAVLGVVETNGKEGDTIPLTHPWRVRDVQFTPYNVELSKYGSLEADTDADLSILLTHLGSSVDSRIAEGNHNFDIIVGGHSHEVIDRKVDDIPVVQAGANFEMLGRMDLIISEGTIASSEVRFINLGEYEQYDEALQAKIDDYIGEVHLDEVIGYSKNDMSKPNMGCFYTDALMNYLQTDVALQNTGGVRSTFDAGDITMGEVFDMDPFSNHCVIFKMAVSELETFFMNADEGFHVSGMQFGTDHTGFALYDTEGHVLSETDSLMVGVNDYIPAVHDRYFPYDRADIKDYTTAEAIIKYLQNASEEIDYAGCDNYQRYRN